MPFPAVLPYTVTFMCPCSRVLHVKGMDACHALYFTDNRHCASWALCSQLPPGHLRWSLLRVDASAWVLFHPTCLALSAGCCSNPTGIGSLCQDIDLFGKPIAGPNVQARLPCWFPRVCTAGSSQVTKREADSTASHPLKAEDPEVALSPPGQW